MMRVLMGANRQLSLHAVNHSSLIATQATQLAQITITDSSQPYSNNLLAYRPRFNDFHGSGLGAMMPSLSISRALFHAYHLLPTTTQSAAHSPRRKMDSGVEKRS